MSSSSKSTLKKNLSTSTNLKSSLDNSSSKKSGESSFLIRLTKNQFMIWESKIHRTLFNYAKQQLLEEDAENAVCDARFQALRNIAKFDSRDGEIGFYNWMMSILKLEIANQYRTINKRKEILIDSTTAIGIDSIQEEAIRISIKNELKDKFRSVGLTRRQQQCFFAYMDDTPRTVIASRLCIDVKTVDYHIQCATRRLRNSNALDLTKEAIELFKTFLENSVYYKPQNVWDHNGNTETIQRRRYKEGRKSILPMPNYLKHNRKHGAKS